MTTQEMTKQEMIMNLREKREEKKKSEVKRKAKLRHKDTKNIGKRRKPSTEKTDEK